jgi:hypothetical protein
MRELPVIFSGPMVQALLNTKPGTWPAEPVDPSKPYKSIMRRVIKPSPCMDKNGCVNIKGFWTIPEKDTGTALFGIAPYSIGDILWVRETWGINGYNNQDGYIIFVRYKAGGHDLEIDLDDEALWERYVDQEAKWYENHDENEIKWRPFIFMPREASRITLKVKGVRIERVQDITEEDAKAEGVFRMDYKPMGEFIAISSYRASFCQLWDILNANRGYSWESNPYVFVYEFMRV